MAAPTPKTASSVAHSPVHPLSAVKRPPPLPPKSVVPTPKTPAAPATKNAANAEPGGWGIGSIFVDLFQSKVFWVALIGSCLVAVVVSILFSALKTTTSENTPPIALSEAASSTKEETDTAVNAAIEFAKNDEEKKVNEESTKNMNRVKEEKEVSDENKTTDKTEEKNEAKPDVNTAEVKGDEKKEEEAKAVEVVQEPEKEAGEKVPVADKKPKSEEKAPPSAADKRAVELPDNAVAHVTKEVPPEELDPELRLGASVAALELKKTPYCRALDAVGQLAGLPVTLDADALEALGVSASEPISLKIENSTAAKLLERLAAMKGLVVELRGMHVVVTSPDVASNELQELPYAVADLAPNEKTKKELAGWMIALIEPASWQDRQGQGVFRIESEVVVVKQTPPIHRRIADLFERLRIARGLPVQDKKNAERYARSTNDLYASEKFQKKVSGNFRTSAALVDILNYLGGAAGVSVVIDREALAADERTDRMEVSYVVAKKPLEESIEELVGAVQLAWRPLNASTFLVTTQKAMQNNPRIEFYSLKEVAERGEDVASLLERLQKSVEPSSWSDRGGWGVVVYDPASKTAIIRQSAPIQRAVKLFFNEKVGKTP